ncbi:protein kinase domain-containing protein [Actinoplanes subtropicus]|uniref:protein kinase domain-containing protein n=1 Tax=Actinoplanes subtropicus TaxID=543632 RepID=UPI0014702447|nr:protein kinase [Actinoplanes subtropicus]
MRGQLRPTDPRRLGRYRLEARLGQGGMGTVYLGRGRDGRPVAIKVIKPELVHDEEFRGRFRSEVNRARQVPPFSTAEVLDADADHETPYLVTEYVDGPSLAEVIADQGPLTGGSLYSVAVGVATALAAIHGAGVIHRDLKPRNVLFALGTPKVIDFGIARAFEATSQHTATDQMVGTVGYMAPERFDTVTDRALGPAADVFAWGVVVAYAATGRTPFDADSPVATAARILTQPPNLAGLPGPLRDLVAAALDKNPDRRPTATELLDHLVAAGVPHAAALPAVGLTRPRAEPTGTARRRRWRRTAPVLTAATVVAIAAAVFAFSPVRAMLRSASADPQASDPAVAALPPSGAPASPSAGPTPSPVTSRTPRQAARPAAEAGGATVTASPATRVRLCTNADITVAISAQNDVITVGTQRGLVNVVNKSGTSCRVDGRVSIRLYNAADEQVDVPAKAVDQPGPAVDITLRPGGGAFEGIKWQACDRNDSNCPTGNTIRAGLSSAGGVVADLDGFPAAADSRITMSSVQLGTLQPSRIGVVAW